MTVFLVIWNIMNTFAVIDLSRRLRDHRHPRKAIR